MGSIKRFFSSPLLYGTGAVVSAAIAALSWVGIPSVQSEHERVIYLLWWFTIFVVLAIAAFVAIHRENIELRKPRLAICFEEIYPYIQGELEGGAEKYRLFRVSILNRTRKTIDDVSVELAAMEPMAIRTPLLLHQKDDNILRASNYKETFSLDPMRPKYIDVVQQQPGISDFEIIHTIPAVERFISRHGRYRIKLIASGRDSYEEGHFIIDHDSKGKLTFYPEGH